MRSTRAYNSTSLNSQPTIQEVKETKAYCDATPGQNITDIGQVASTRIFLSNKLLLQHDRHQFIANNTIPLNLFAQVLLECATVYSVSPQGIHIFYDEAGSTIAFNQNSSLFFNFRYFSQLHLQSVQRNGKMAAVPYWAVVMAHELA